MTELGRVTTCNIARRRSSEGTLPVVAVATRYANNRPSLYIRGPAGERPIAATRKLLFEGKTELHPGVLRMGPVFCEFEAQSRLEGDMQQMPADFPVTELWQVLSVQHKGRTAHNQVTIFDSVGFALEDCSALCYIRDFAAEFGMAETLSLIPALANPQDLFGFLAENGGALTSAAVANALDD
ncbi:MAG: hypothetical protein ABIP49_08020 [Lysobacterales bacterium]